MLSTTISGDIINDIENVTINWSTQDGTIGSTDLNALEIEVLSGGTYTFEVINTENGCSNAIDIFVPENAESPIFEIETVNSITCDNPQVVISAIVNNPSTNQNMEWTTINGNIIGSTDGASIIADAEGEYTLLIVDAISGCSDEQTVFVSVDVEKPEFVLNDPHELNCTILETELSALVGNTTDINILWTTVDGNLSGPSDEITTCLLYTSPSPRDQRGSRMPSSA